MHVSSGIQVSDHIILRDNRVSFHSWHRFFDSESANVAQQFCKVVN